MPGEGQGLCALAEQRGERAEVRLNRVCSALTQVVTAVVGKRPSQVNLLPAVGSGQLWFLGSMGLGEWGGVRARAELD